MNDYRNYLNDTLEQRLIPGVSAIIRKGDETLLHEGFGYADREARRKVTPDTVLGIGSVTKSFTALAIMQLHDAGKLNVDASVADYLTNFTRSGATDLTGITLHHSLTNTSGLPPLPFLRSTTGDMARYAQVYFGNTELISPESLERMTHPHVRTSPERWYGYGLMVQPDYHGHKMVEHGGNLKGMAAWLTMFPELELVGVMLANITGGPVADMTLAGLNVVLDLPLNTEREEHQAVSLPTTQLEKFTGLYRSDENAEVRIELTDGALVADVKEVRLDATPVASDSLLVNMNGANTLMQFLEESDKGFGALFFGYRVLERVE